MGVGFGATPRRCCLGIGCLAFFLCVLVGIVLMVSFHTPSVEVVETEVMDLNMTSDRASLDLDLTIHVVNNNSAPIAGTISDLIVDVYSLDKFASDHIGDIFKIGIAKLPEPVTMPASSEIEFVVSINVVIESNGSTALLYSRLGRDCAENSTNHTTKIRVLLTRAVVGVAKIHVPLDALKVSIDRTLPCLG